MMPTVQLAIADAVYAAALRDALARTGPWQVISAKAPDLALKCVLVLDEDTFDRLPLALPDPETVVLITQKDPKNLSKAWDAGIVSVVSDNDSQSTVLLAIMAAALRVKKTYAAAAKAGAISPSTPPGVAPISPNSHHPVPKRPRTP